MPHPTYPFSAAGDHPVDLPARRGQAHFDVGGRWTPMTRLATPTSTSGNCESCHTMPVVSGLAQRDAAGRQTRTPLAQAHRLASPTRPR
jgi:hypothetical protein